MCVHKYMGAGHQEVNMRIPLHACDKACKQGTGVAVAQQKGLMSSNFFFKCLKDLGELLTRILADFPSANIHPVFLHCPTTFCNVKSNAPKQNQIAVNSGANLSPLEI